MDSLEDFWGVCLDGTKKVVEWSGNDVAGLEDDDLEQDVEQTLELRQACLGVNAKDERNIVNITANDASGEPITQSILSMKMGIHEQTQLFLTLFPPITLELVSGTGPIYISGTVTSKIAVDSEEEDEEDEEEEMENTSASVSPAVAANKAVGKKRPADSPIQKPAKAVKVEKKDDKVIKSSVPAKGSKSKKPSEEDDEEDGYEDEDEEGEDSEEEDEEAESGEEEEEIQAKPVKQKKNAGAQKKSQAPPTTPKSGGVIGTKESGKKQGKQEPMSIDDVKEKLLKTPTIPKKVDKFNNYISNSYKITDDKIKKQLWEFVQKNRPQS